jgi:hypothetical protein
MPFSPGLCHVTTLRPNSFLNTLSISIITSDQDAASHANDKRAGQMSASPPLRAPVAYGHVTGSVRFKLGQVGLQLVRRGKQR